MSVEAFGIQETSNEQEAKISINETNLFNELLDLRLNNYTKDHDAVNAVISELKSTVDNFNSWVDKKILIWSWWKANSWDETESYEWAKTATEEDFRKVLETKVAELNAVVNKMVENYSRDTDTLKQNVWNILWVESFVASVPKSFLIWDWNLSTPEQIQIAEAEEARQAEEANRKLEERRRSNEENRTVMSAILDTATWWVVSRGRDNILKR